MPNGSLSERAGFASGAVRLLLRLEGLAVMVGAVAVFGQAGFSWRLLALLFLAPDLSMLGYLAGPRVGAAAYDALHTYVGPLLLAGAAHFTNSETALAVALVWIAHIGFDRALGYGLKYATRFGDTHLGPTGRTLA
jgi:hypothetical protein